MPVVKIVELIGSSPDGWKEAVENAVKEAAKTVKNIRGGSREAMHCKSRRQQDCRVPC